MIVILVALAILWVAGYANKPDPFRLYQPDELFFIQFFAVSLGGAGFVSIVRGLDRALAKNLPRRTLPRVFPKLKLRNLMPWKGHRDSPSLVMASLNAFSVSWICVLMTLVNIFMIIRPLPPKGLRIDWIRRSHIPAVESPWGKTMSVYVAHSGQFYVNGKVIKQELEKALREELGQCVEWTVYVEADNDTPFMDTVYAIDTIQGLGGKVVWITPRTRAEWKQQDRLNSGRK
jgi:biopolymer transport protein ExbD